jgi:outer membrane protein OmpA-like peptidoglycan-associated protein
VPATPPTPAVAPSRGQPAPEPARQAARPAPPPPAAPTPVARPAPTPVAPPPAAAEPEKPKVAMAAPPVGFGDSLALGFHPGSAALTREAEQQLDRLVAQLRDGDQRLQLKAFASADGDNTSRARRTSLSRALAVRSYLIEAGIRSTRIDVRALGVARDGGAEDRVDVILLGQ